MKQTSCDYSRLQPAESGAKLGIDIGGTDIKYAVIDDGEIKVRRKTPSCRESEEKLLDEIAVVCKELYAEYPYDRIGVGAPGVIYGGLLTTNNLPFKNCMITKELERRTGLPVTADNDANCAALGEILYGSGKDYRNAVLITLGTGIGGGIIVDGKILQGRGGAGELGHITIQAEDGLLCTCGQKGCWEQYGSVGAFVRQATDAAVAQPDSLLFKAYQENGKLNGKLIFEALEQKCPVAEAVFDQYLDWVAIGIRSLKMVFDPEVFLLAGGITKQGDTFLNPLLAKLGEGFTVKIATLQDDAGVFGAANL